MKRKKCKCCGQWLPLEKPTCEICGKPIPKGNTRFCSNDCCRVSINKITGMLDRFEVARMIKKGMSVTKIAKDLHINKDTLTRYVTKNDLYKLSSEV